MLNSSKAIYATEGNDKGKGNEATVIFFAKQVCAFFNEYVDKGKFGNCLKLVNIMPVLKESACSSKNNCVYEHIA